MRAPKVTTSALRSSASLSALSLVSTMADLNSDFPASFPKKLTSYLPLTRPPPHFEIDF
jgi:hypothetical protein